MKGVIMAGGEGTRLRPLTCSKPKPMMPLMNKPIMEHIIKLLKKHNITDLCVTLQYMPEIIQEYFEDGSKHQVNLQYFIEDTPLGTAGSVKNAQGFLNETFVVISGDVLCDIDLDEAYKFHKEKGSIATLVLTKMDIPLEFGVVVTDQEGKIIRFLEKPGWGEVFSDTINTGIYILEPEVLDYFNSDKTFDFSKDLFPLLLKENKPMYGYISNGYWCDIGNPIEYRNSHIDIFNYKVRGDFWHGKVINNIYTGRNVSLPDNCKIYPPVAIGDNCKIEDNVTLKPYTVIGDNCIIEESSIIKRSILWNNTLVGKNSRISGSIVCSNNTIKNNVYLFENTIIGENSLLNKRVSIKPNIKIWPEKIISEGSIISDDIVWGTKSHKNLFGNNGIYGKVNIDISPETASKIGSAYGANLRDKSKIVISSCQDNETEMIKLALTSGIISMGHDVIDLGTSLPMLTKWAIPYYEMNGGIHIQDDIDDNILITFYDSNGYRLNRNLQRKIQNSFCRNDFMRCKKYDIKRPYRINKFNDYYIRTILKDIDIYKVVNSDLALSVECEDTITESLLKNILQRLGVVLIKNSNIKSSLLKIKLDKFGENLSLQDSLGNKTDSELNLLLMTLIRLKKENEKSLNLPLDSPRIAEDIASKYNGKIVWTKVSAYEPYDTFKFIAKLLEYKAINKTNLNDLLKEIPKYYWSKRTVPCRWEEKGKVIRQLTESGKYHERIETIEGVKLHDKEGCVLVMPDAEKPFCRVFGEGYTEEYAKNITEELVDRIKKIQNN